MGNPSLQIVNSVAELAREKLGMDAIRNGAKDYSGCMAKIGDDFDLGQIRDALFCKKSGYYCFLRALSWAAGFTG